MKVLIIKSRGKSVYHRKIAKHLRKYGVKTYVASWKWEGISKKIKKYKLGSNNTLIYCRAGGYLVSRNLKYLEDRGYKVIPSSKSVFLTSNKYISQLIAYDGGLSVAPTYLVHKNDVKRVERLLKVQKYLIIKPIFSPGGSLYCEVLKRNDNGGLINTKLKKIPGNLIIAQKYTEHDLLIRCVVINNILINELTTFKKNTDYKISRAQKRIGVYNADEKLKKIAQTASKIFDNKIFVVDFFHTKNGKYIFNEANNASGFTDHDKVSGIQAGELIAAFLVKNLFHR